MPAADTQGVLASTSDGTRYLIWRGERYRLGSDLAVDALASRYAVDRETALRRLEKAGAILTTVETCAFEWMGGSNHPQFKAVSALVQERMRRLRELSPPGTPS